MKPASESIVAFSTGAPIRFIGSVPQGFGFATNDKPIPDVGTDLSHYGADCRSPDAYLQNSLLGSARLGSARLGSVADDITAMYKKSNSTNAASDATAASVPAVSQ